MRPRERPRYLLAAPLRRARLSRMWRAARRWGSTAGIVLALALGAAPAGAAERFVRPDADPSCASTPNCHQTIAAAADAAGDGDVITIGHNGGVAYAENVALDGRGDVTFRGEPGARPEIQGSPVVPGPVFRLGPGADRTAISHLSLSGSLDNGAIAADAATAGVEISDVAATCVGGVTCLRLAGAEPRVSDTDVVLGLGPGLTLDLPQGGSLLRVSSTGGGASVHSGPPPAEAAIRESSFSSPAGSLPTLSLGGSGTAAGLGAVVSRTRVSSGGDLALRIDTPGSAWTISNSLVTADGDGGGSGRAFFMGPDTSTTLRNVTVAGPGHAAQVSSVAGAPVTLTATNTVLRGALGDLRTTVLPGGSAGIAISNSAVRGVPGAGNVSADPLFAGPSDFHPQPGSPLVDAGAPVPPGDLDLDGVARPRGLAADIGAYESPFTAAGAAPPPPPPAFQPPPRPPQPAPQRPSAAVRPAIRSLSLDPVAFRRPGRTRVSFRLDVAARVTFRIERRTRGARGTKRCVRRTRRTRARPCALYVRLPASFTRTGRRGRNVFRFTGLGGSLPAGSYRLRATARAGAFTSRARTARFRIERAAKPTARG